MLVENLEAEMRAKFGGKEYEVPPEQELLRFPLGREVCRVTVEYPITSDGRFVCERPEIPRVRFQKQDKIQVWHCAERADIEFIAVEAVRRLAMDSPVVRKPEPVSEFMEYADGN